MYLGVSEISRGDNGLRVDNATGEIIDYAVRMKRMDDSKRMDRLLKTGDVTPVCIQQLAEILAEFHKTASQISTPFDVDAIFADYADITASGNGSSVADILQSSLGAIALQDIQDSVEFAGRFLHRYRGEFERRSQEGYMIDGHGDLHAANIFLTNPPTIFDCIEFNDHFRQVDILDELAFFTMDLQRFERNDLAKHFLNTYHQLNPSIHSEHDRAIFHYYHLYRANVKLKINALKIIQAGGDTASHPRVTLLKSYFGLFKKYFSIIRKVSGMGRS